MKKQMIHIWLVCVLHKHMRGALDTSSFVVLVILLMALSQLEGESAWAVEKPVLVGFLWNLDEACGVNSLTASLEWLTGSWTKVHLLHSQYVKHKRPTIHYKEMFLPQGHKMILFQPVPTHSQEKKGEKK